MKEKTNNTDYRGLFNVVVALWAVSLFFFMLLCNSPQHLNVFNEIDPDSEVYHQYPEGSVGAGIELMQEDILEIIQGSTSDKLRYGKMFHVDFEGDRYGDDGTQFASELSSHFENSYISFFYNPSILQIYYDDEETVTMLEDVDGDCRILIVKNNMEAFESIITQDLGEVEANIFYHFYATELVSWLIEGTSNYESEVVRSILTEDEVSGLALIHTPYNSIFPEMHISVEVFGNMFTGFTMMTISDAALDYERVEARTEVLKSLRFLS